MIEVKIIRSNRKSVALQIKPDLTVEVRAPYRVTQRDINKILDEKKAWIDKHMQIIRDREAQMSSIPRITSEDIKKLADKALQYIPERVEHFAPIVGVDYRRITIRNQKTRWGSCSAKGGLNFNCLLMMTPPEVIDYVVVHELCHRKEMNHSKNFWNEVEKVLPDYTIARNWLKEFQIGFCF